MKQLQDKQSEMKARLYRAKPNSKLTNQEELYCVWLRSRGFTLGEIGKLYGMTEGGVSIMLERRRAK